MIPQIPGPVIDLALRSSQLAIESHIVIALRLFGMVGLWPVHGDESSRMIAEKAPAWIKAAGHGHQSLLSGGRLDEILLATIEPLRYTAQSNRERLLQTAAAPQASAI